MFAALVAAHRGVVPYDEVSKGRWQRAGARVARRFAKDLGGKASWNPGGIAVEGDHSVCAPGCWLELCGSRYPWGSLLFRKATPEDKYGACSINQWAPLPSNEDEYQALLAKVRAL